MTPAELDAALTATATSRLLKGKNSVQHLGNVSTPTLNMFRSKGKANATPVRGAYKAHLAAPRGGRLQSVSGRDIHTFQSIDTLFDIEHAVGRVHLGDEWVHQQLEEAGVEIDYANAYQTKIDIKKDGWWTKGADKLEVLVNLANVKLDACDLNYVQELNKALWLSNLDDPKLWPGIDAALPVTTNTVGPFGDKDRSNPLLRHQVAPAVAGADLELTFSQKRRAANKRTKDGSKLSFAVGGENVYDLIVEQMFSGSTATTSPSLTRNLNQALDQAQALGQKFGIGFPDDAIYITGVGLFMIEPVFEDLDAQYMPAIPWQDRFFFMNLDHIQFKATKGKDGAKVVHATPYNQRVTRFSTFGEYALVLDKADCHVAGYIA